MSLGLSCCCSTIMGGTNTPPPPADVSIVNIGGGAEVYVTPTGPNPFEMRTFVSSDASITVTETLDTIDLTIALQNLGDPATDGCAVWNENVNPYQFKRIYVDPDDGISLSCEPNRIRVFWTGGASNEGGGAEILDTGLSNDHSFILRTLIPGAGISITENATTIEIAATAAAATSANVGGQVEVYKTGTSGPFVFRTLTGSSGIGVTQGTDVITMTNLDPGSGVTVSSVGAGDSVINDGTGPAIALRSFIAGSGIGITATLTDLTIINGSPATLVALTNAGTTSLVNDGTGPSLATKGLVASTGISFSTSATDVTITNSSPASGVTLASAGGTETLVNDGTGPAVATKGLTAGTGMTLTGSATDVTITNASPASSVTLTSAGGTETLVNDGTGPAIALKGLTAGTGISLTGAATLVTIANTDPASGVTLANAGTTTLVNDGTGPALALKGLVAGTNVSFSTTATDVTINAAASASTGLELVVNVNGSDVAVSTRRVTAPNRTSFATQVYINIAAGSQTVKLRAKSVSAGTINLHNVQMTGQSTLGASITVSTTAFSTSSTSFVDVTSITASANAGEWFIVISGDCTPP